MSRSRKLIVAAVLLAGGYGLALVASGLSDLLWARRLIGGGATSHSGGASLESNSISGPTAVGTARLVPDSASRPVEAKSALQGTAPTTSTAAHSTPPPTWLVPAQQAGWTEASNDKQGDGTAAANHLAGSSVAADVRAEDGDATTLERQPRARLTDVARSSVTAAGQRSASQGLSASPWDRWPRWDPPAASVARATIDDREPAATASIGPPSAPHAHHASFDGSADADADDLAELRTHFVVDGDSLSKLAERYLDDPQLGDAIYQLNRDSLSDPELLPIGTELRIPARRMARSSRVGLPGRDPARPAVIRLPDLIPVDDDAWQPASGPPRAQLLRPQPPSATPAAVPAASSSW